MAKESGHVSILKSLGVSAASATLAESITLPLDTAKVRLQLQNRKALGAQHALGPIGTVRRIYSTEGAPALWKGLEAGVHRQLIFTGLRVGLYGHILDGLSGKDDRADASLLSRVTAALTTSALGITAANPSDVVKVRTQASSQPAIPSAPAAAAGAEHARRPAVAAHAPQAMLCRSQAPAAGAPGAGAGGQRTMTHRPAGSGIYSGSAWGVYAHIVKSEGVLGGLYSGYVPNLIRNSIISASELVAYDVSKREYALLGVPDGPGLHLLAGLSAGLLATLLGNPMDVVSTRIMVHKASGVRSGMVDTCRRMFVKEGPLSFYQGFVPNFARIGSFNVVLWMSLEQISALVG